MLLTVWVQSPYINTQNEYFRFEYLFPYKVELMSILLFLSIPMRTLVHMFFSVVVCVGVGVLYKMDIKEIIIRAHLRK